MCDGPGDPDNRRPAYRTTGSTERGFHTATIKYGAAASEATASQRLAFKDKKIAIHWRISTTDIELRILSLSAQATTGKQGVLGPTKIYLAVQPVQAPNNQQQQQQTSQVSSTASTPVASTPKQQQPIVSPPPATGIQYSLISYYYLNDIYNYKCIHVLYVCICVLIFI